MSFVFMTLNNDIFSKLSEILSTRPSFTGGHLSSEKTTFDKSQ